MKKTLILLLLLSSCRGYDGERLSSKHCSACHLLPQPDVHAKKDWPEVLFRMGLHLGIADYALVKDPGREQAMSKLVRQLRGKKLVPSKAKLPAQQWDAIKTHYLESAPKALRFPAKQLNFDPRGFRVREFFRGPASDAWLTPIHTTTNSILAGDIKNARVYRFDFKGRLRDSAKLPSSAIRFVEDQRGLYLGLIGDLRPSDRRRGKVVFIRRGRRLSHFRELIGNLYRTAHIGLASLDGTGSRPAVLVSGFGNNLGRASVFRWKKNKFEEHVMVNRPGPVMSQVHDFNGDRLPDIMWLVAQGDESLLLFVNKGNGSFEERRIQQWQPAMGFVRFYLADFNNDDHMDVLLLNGDNGDLPGQPLRPYHGLRILENQGNLRFKQVMFYPMHGALDAVVRDFDQDGHQDIAAIANYPDYQSGSPENFVYLANDKGQWKPRHLKETMTIELGGIASADVDRDGDQDIILGGRYTGWKFKLPAHKVRNNLLLENRFNN